MSFLYPTSMRAARVYRFGGPEVLSVHHALSVSPLATNQVLVQMVCAGVNPVETYIREGQYSKLPDLPYTPGSDGAGRVAAVGRDVTALNVGQRVFVTGPNSGSYAEYVVCDDAYVFPLHPRLSYAQGAALGVPYFTAYKALVMGAKAKPAEVVLIHGASGAVGTAAVQIARSIGCIVVGTAGTKEGMDVVARCGAHHVFNHNHKGYEKRMIEHVAVTSTISSGGNSNSSGHMSSSASPGTSAALQQTVGGFDVIIEHLANINLGQDLQMLNPGARVMIVGCRGAVTINPRHLMLPEAKIMGIQLGTSTATAYREMGSAIVAAVEVGALSPVINREYALADVRQVHTDIVQTRGAKGKLVLRIAPDSNSTDSNIGSSSSSTRHCQVGNCYYQQSSLPSSSATLSTAPSTVSSGVSSAVPCAIPAPLPVSFAAIQSADLEQMGHDIKFRSAGETTSFDLDAYAAAAAQLTLEQQRDLAAVQEQHAQEQQQRHQRQLTQQQQQADASVRGALRNNILSVTAVPIHNGPPFVLQATVTPTEPPPPGHPLHHTTATAMADLRSMFRVTGAAASDATLFTQSTQSSRDACLAPTNLSTADAPLEVVAGSVEVAHHAPTSPYYLMQQPLPPHAQSTS